MFVPVLRFRLLRAARVLRGVVAGWSEKPRKPAFHGDQWRNGF
jgi:hypothetical protein